MEKYGEEIYYKPSRHKGLRGTSSRSRSSGIDEKMYLGPMKGSGYERDKYKI
jgi:hypothetical protein